MRKLNLLAIAALAICWTGCSKDSELIPDTNPEEEVKSAVTLTVKNTATIGTRHAPTEENASGDEVALDATKPLKVAVFKVTGELVGTHTLSLTDNHDGTYTSDEFQTLSGRKYVYVFANDGSNITLPSAGTMSDFQKQVINVTYTAGVPNITGSHFLLGTLWAEKVNVPVGGVTGTPKTMTLEIGRLASKVTMGELTATKPENMNGAFDLTSAKYRVGSVAKKINTVGFHIGEPLPTLNQNVIVESAVHTAAPWTEAIPNTANFDNFNVSAWTDANKVDATDKKYFYITENTTKPDAHGMQYYGNTTFIQFAVKYAPTAAEVLNPTDLSATAQIAGDGTFYTARKKSTSDWVILNAKPVEGTADANLDLTEIREYKQGICYYKFPIQDKNEADYVCKYRVLRNHIYDFKVTKVLELGEPDEKVDPDEPITPEEQTYVVVEVSVKGWDVVETGDIEV